MTSRGVNGHNYQIINMLYNEKTNFHCPPLALNCNRETNLQNQMPVENQKQRGFEHWKQHEKFLKTFILPTVKAINK